jgi:hypothetical protein
LRDHGRRQQLVLGADGAGLAGQRSPVKAHARRTPLARLDFDLQGRTIRDHSVHDQIGRWRTSLHGSTRANIGDDGSPPQLPLPR